MRWLVTTFPDIGYKLNGEVCGQGVGVCVVSFLTLQTVHPLNQYWFFSVIMTHRVYWRSKRKLKQMWQYLDIMKLPLVFMLTRTLWWKKRFFQIHAGVNRKKKTTHSRRLDILVHYKIYFFFPLSNWNDKNFCWFKSCLPTSENITEDLIIKSNSGLQCQQKNRKVGEELGEEQMTTPADKGHHTESRG